jgi:hypothetical protein
MSCAGPWKSSTLGALSLLDYFQLLGEQLGREALWLLRALALGLKGL